MDSGKILFALTVVLSIAGTVSGCVITTTTTTLATTTTTLQTTTTTIPTSAPEFTSTAIPAVIMLLAPSVAYVMAGKRD